MGKAPTQVQVARNAEARREGAKALQRLARWIGKNPGARQLDAIQYAKTKWGWAKSTTQWRWNQIQDGRRLVHDARL